MFKVERGGNTFEFIMGPEPTLRTAGPGEEPMTIDLEGFPRQFYIRIVEAIPSDSGRYGAVQFFPLQEEAPAMMVMPQQGREERFITLYWFHPGIGPAKSTRFHLDLELPEAKQLLRYMEEHTTIH